MSKITYPVELPRDVVSLSRSKPKPHRDDWLLVAASDEYCDVVQVYVGSDGDVEVIERESSIRYENFWRAIKEIATPRVTTWMTCFRAKYLLHKIGWIDALARGEIELERQRKLAGKQAGRGAMCLSQGITELDLRVGNRKIKLLDFDNFAVSAQQYSLDLARHRAVDVLRVFTDLVKALGAVGLSASRTSAPQIGWAKLRQSLGDYEIFTSLDPEIRALERRCYYGGRCEPYRLGEVNQQVYSVDVRGAYAAVCRDENLPWMPARYFPDGTAVAEASFAGDCMIAADCVVKTDSPLFPVRLHGKTIYPVGRFFTSLCGAEFSAALSLGCVEKITRAVGYYSAPVLRNYAEWYFDARARVAEIDNGRLAGVVKAAFNSSLGFLARQGREWSPWEPAGSAPWWFGITVDPDDAGQVVGAHTLAGDSEILRIGSEPRNGAPIVHAAICAAMRVRLAGLMAAARRQNVLYCDTDGILVTKSGLENLAKEHSVFGADYGQASVRSDADRCTINGQKNYKLGDKVVCAGLTRERHGGWKENVAHDTETGIVNNTGKVAPYTLSCEDTGDETARWKNSIVRVG